MEPGGCKQTAIKCLNSDALSGTAPMRVLLQSTRQMSWPSDINKRRILPFHNDVNAFRFTRLYPFILYDVCPETERNDIIVWKGFDGDSPIYQSIFYSDEITPDTTLYHDKYQKLKNDFWNTINYIEKLVQ